jgi:hypothetical protein
MMQSKVVPLLCALSLCFGAFVESQLISLDISLNNYGSKLIVSCITLPLICFAAISLFLDSINVHNRFLARGLWLKLVWIIAAVNLIGLFMPSRNGQSQKQTSTANADSTTSQRVGCWDNDMDVLLDIYESQWARDSGKTLSDREDFYSSLSRYDSNCLLDSLLKIDDYLGFVDVQLLFQTPDSILNYPKDKVKKDRVLNLSKEAIENVKSSPNSCARELWMLALSERGILEYEFKNESHIKKFESVQPTAEQLNSYWVFEHDFGQGAESGTANNFALKNNQLRKIYKVEGNCTGRIVGSNDNGVAVELTIKLNDENRECWLGDKTFPYYISSSEKLHFKMTPPSRSIAPVTGKFIRYDRAHEQVKPLLASDSILLPWEGLKRDSSSEDAEIERTFYREVGARYPKVVPFERFTKISKGQSMIIDIPCLDEKIAKTYGSSFNVVRPLFPILRCEIAPADKDYFGE